MFYATVYSAFLFLLLNENFIQSNSYSFKETRSDNSLRRKSTKGINNVTYNAAFDSDMEKYSLESKVSLKYNILPEENLNSSWNNKYWLQEIVNNVLNLKEITTRAIDNILMHPPTALLERHRRSGVHLKQNGLGNKRLNKITHLKHKAPKRHHEVETNGVIEKYSGMKKTNPMVSKDYVSQTSEKHNHPENLNAQSIYHLDKKPKFYHHLENSPTRINRMSHTVHDPKGINSKKILHQINHFKVPKKKNSNHPIEKSKFFDKAHESSKEIAKKQSEGANPKQNNEMHAEAGVPKVIVEHQGNSLKKKDVVKGKTDAKTISNSTSHPHGDTKQALSRTEESKMVIERKAANAHARHPTPSTSNRARHFVLRRHMNRHNKRSHAKNFDAKQIHDGSKSIKKNNRNATRNMADLMHKQHAKIPTNFSHGKTRIAQEMGSHLKNPAKLKRQRMFHGTGNFRAKEGVRRNSNIAKTHPFENEMYNLHEPHSNHRSLKRSSRRERDVLDEVRDFIVNNFMGSKHKRMSQNEESKKISKLSHVVDSRDHGKSTNGNISVSTAKNRGRHLLEEIKDFVVRHFHPKKLKRRLTVREDNVSKSSSGNAYSKNSIKSTSRLVKREVDQATTSNEVFISTAIDYDAYNINEDNQFKREVDSQNTATEETNLNYLTKYSELTSDQSVTQFSELPNIDEEYSNMTEDYFDVKSEKISEENNSNSNNRRTFNSSKGKRESPESQTSELHDEETVTSVDESVSETVSETLDIAHTAVDGDRGGGSEITTASNSYDTDETLNTAASEDDGDRSEASTGNQDSLNSNNVIPSVNDVSEDRIEDFSETPVSFNTADDLNTAMRRDNVIGSEMSSEASVALNGDVTRVTRAYEGESDTTSEISDYLSSNKGTAEDSFESSSKNWDVSEETSTISQFSLDDPVSTLSTVSSINTDNEEEVSNTYTTVNEDFLTDVNSMSTTDVETTERWNAEGRVPKELFLSSTDSLSSPDLNEENLMTSSNFDSTNNDLSSVESSLPSETTSVDSYEVSSPITSFTESPFTQTTMASNTVFSSTSLEEFRVQTKISRAIQSSRREEEYDYGTPEVNFPDKKGKDRKFSVYPEHLRPKLLEPDEIQNSSDLFQENENELVYDDLEYVNDQPNSESSTKNKKMINHKKVTHFPESHSDRNEKQKHGSIDNERTTNPKYIRVVKLNDRINHFTQKSAKNTLSHATKVNSLEKPKTNFNHKLKNHSKPVQNGLESHPIKNNKQKENALKLSDSKTVYRVKKPTSNHNVVTQISRKNGEKKNAEIKSLKDEKNRKNVPESMKDSSGHFANKRQEQLLRKTIKNESLKHQPHYQNAPPKQHSVNLKGTKVNNRAKASSKRVSGKQHSSIKPEVRTRNSTIPVSHHEKIEQNADEEYDYEMSSVPSELGKETLFSSPTNRAEHIYQNSLHKNLRTKGIKNEDKVEYDYEDSPGTSVSSKNSQREINSNVIVSDEGISQDVFRQAETERETDSSTEDGAEYENPSDSTNFYSTLVYSDSKLITRHPKENNKVKSLDKKDDKQSIKTGHHENPQSGKRFNQHNEGVSKVTEIKNSIQNTSAAGSEIASTLDVTEDNEYEYEDLNETDYVSNIISLETTTTLKSENLPRNLNKNILGKTAPKTFQKESQNVGRTSYIPSSGSILQQMTKKGSITVSSKQVRDKTHTAIHRNENSNQNENLKLISHSQSGTLQKHKKEMPVNKKYNSAFTTHAVTLQNLKIMPEGTTALTTGVPYATTKQFSQETSSFAEEDYENSNGTVEEYYDETTEEQDSSTALRYQSDKNKIAKSVKELEDAKDRVNNLEEYSDDVTDVKNDLLNNNGSTELASSSDDAEGATDDYLLNMSESDSTSGTPEEVHTAPSDELVERHGKLKSYLRKLRSYLHSKHKHHPNKRYDVPIQIKSRKRREVSEAVSTTLPEFHTDHISPTGQWLFGIMGLLMVASLIVAMYLSFTKLKGFDTSFIDELKYDTGRTGDTFLTTGVQINQ